MSVVLVEIEISAAGIADPIPEPIPSEPNGYVVWIIQNNDSKKHKVSISPAEFKGKNGTEPKEPINPLAVPHADVEPGDTGAILLHVKGKDHFKEMKKKGKKPHAAGPTSFTYKYTIRATGLAALDPQIEINN